jgi:hypothetical protein
VSLGSFSEVQAVLDPALLEKVLAELAAELSSSKTAAPEGLPPRRKTGGEHRWLIVDCTLWKVLPRMPWALWRRQHGEEKAVRLHLGLHLFEETWHSSFVGPNASSGARTGWPSASRA